MAVSKPGSLESDTTLDGIKVVKALLRAGAYVNAETGGFDVYMPLHLAIGAGSVEVVQILIDAAPMLMRLTEMAIRPCRRHRVSKKS